jgi:hypothetical protein
VNDTCSFKLFFLKLELPSSDHATIEVSFYRTTIEMNLCNIFSLPNKGVQGPDGFSAEFYQVFWDLIKDDLMTLLHEFHQGSLPLFSLNLGMIILLPKCVEALKIQQYMPIFLFNVSFKIFTKVLTNRLTSVAHKVIQPTQTTFVSDKNIMEGVVILHETSLCGTD